MTDSGNMSPADIAALTNSNMDGNGSWIWFLLIFVLLGWGGFGGNRGPAFPPNVATANDVNQAVNDQSVQNGLQQIALSSANNNYETAQLISAQTNALTQQNYTNQINAIQGFNNISQQIAAQSSQISNAIDQLGYHMDQCCCNIRTQLLNDRLEDRNRELAVAQNALNNANQTQVILGNLGRFVAWAGNGTQTTGVVSAS